MKTQHGGHDLIRLKLYLQNQEYRKQQEQVHRTSIGILIVGGLILWIVLLSQGGVWQN